MVIVKLYFVKLNKRALNFAIEHYSGLEGENFMKKIIISLFLLVTIVIVVILLFIRKEPNAGVMIENNILVIKTEDGEEYKKELLYPEFLEEITLNNYEYIKVNGDTIISISMNCTEVEERGKFDTLMIFLYKDSQFINLLDGINDPVFQDKNYSFTYLGDRKINISLPDTDFNITLKNILTYEDPKQNEDNEKDLISRMENQSKDGYPIFSQGLHNIEVNNSVENVKFTFYKFVYGFFHSDIIGEVHYVYEYSDETKSLLQQIKFEPYEPYELVDN